MLPVQSHDKCSEVNGRMSPVDELSMICAGSGGANQGGGCQGESGGPFVCQEGGKWVLRGAVSWGNSMYSTYFFTVFARVSSCKDWIDAKMSGGESSGCGRRHFMSRVVGGENAPKHSWPWQVSLRVWYNGSSYHICGGSLISEQWFVTASHCVVNWDDSVNSPDLFTAVVGAHKRLGTTDVQQEIQVEKVFAREDFSMNHLKNDIALLKLSTPAMLSDKVNTVCLPEQGSRIAAGHRCYITGWGRTVGGGNASDILQQAMLPVRSHDKCSEVNGPMLPVDEQSMICAGSGVSNQGGGCQGDSGGPFVCQEGGSWVLRGAVSWGHGMCSTEFFSVFARVSSFRDWIDATMSTDGGSGELV